MSSVPWLTALTMLPFVGGIIVIGLGNGHDRLARGMAFAISMAALVLAVAGWAQFDPGRMGMQFEEQHDWIRSLGVQYHVGVDGLGMLMVLLTAVIVPLALLGSWKINDRVPIYFGLVLFLQAGLFGTFTALNFFHWFIFWELSLVPAFFLIRLWGGPLRAHAATQFFIYTMVGSVALLLGFLGLYWATGQFDFTELARMAQQGSLERALADKLGWAGSARTLAVATAAGMFLGFAVKVPLVPFHTWLPAAYQEAPTGTTMLLTGLMSKMGLYGFLRVLLPIFGEELRWAQTPLLWLAVLTIVCSAGAAFAQRDLKRILAYSSINHLGYCMLGLFAAAGSTSWANQPAAERAAALNGVMLQMFNHGLTAATLFLFVGWIEERSGGKRGLEDFGGLRKVAPVFCGLMGIAFFSSLGLPGLNGFVGEFLIFKGVFPLCTWAAALSVTGLLVTAVFILTVLQRVFHGQLNGAGSHFADLTLRERLIAAPAIALMFVLGIYPQLLLGTINGSALAMVQQLFPGSAVN